MTLITESNKKRYKSSSFGHEKRINLHKITIAFTGQVLSRKAHDKPIIYANDFAEGLSRDCRNLSPSWRKDLNNYISAVALFGRC